MTYNKKVIQLRASSIWTFSDFVYLSGSNVIEAWYDTESEEVQNLFNALLKNIYKTENHLSWMGWRGYLKGEAKQRHIWEIGFKAEKRQYRILGIFDHKKRKHAILLVGCYHKGKIYSPKL